MFRAVCASFLFVLCSSLLPAAVSSAPEPVYRLRLYHTHTNERLDVVYRRGDQYLDSALEQLDYFLRDHRTGTVHHFDPRLFDLLNSLDATVGHPQGEIDVVCGYRTP